MYLYICVCAYTHTFILYKNHCKMNPRYSAHDVQGRLSIVFCYALMVVPHTLVRFRCQFQLADLKSRKGDGSG